MTQTPLSPWRQPGLPQVAAPGTANGGAAPPASLGQEQLWFIDEFHHGLAAHNAAYQVWLRGPLGVAALERALAGVVARHEPLRTRLTAGGDGRPVQVIDAPAPVTLELTDLAGLAREAALARLREHGQTAALRPFHLAEDRLLRAGLVRLADAEHVLVLVTHQIAFDDQSLRVLLSDLAALYEAEITGEPAALPEVAVRFADYAAWERQHLRGQVLAGLEGYWRGALAGFETTRFPADRPRPLLADHGGAAETVTVSGEVLDGLRELSRRAGTTLPVTLLAALYVLLQRYTGQTDLVVGTTGGRARPELAPLIGFLANTLPVRADLSGDPAFTGLLARVHRAVADAEAHGGLPFARIVAALDIERDPGRFPVFQTHLACAEPPGDVRAAGVEFHAERTPPCASRYDVGFVAEPRPEGLWVEATYTPALFDAATVRRLLGNYQVLLGGIAATPAARLSELPVLTGAELRRELVGWNDTAASFPPVCIHQGFEAQVARDPGAVAAGYEGQQVSYGELNGWANQIARRLRGLGVGPESLVGVCMRTGLRRLAALLGVWKAGGGYVPLDPATPPERLAFVLADTGMSVVIADEQAVERVPAAAGVMVVALEAEWEQIRALDDGDLTGTGVCRSNVAYVIYTSGSTGQPKGVVVEHRQAVNFLQGMAPIWRIGPGSVVLGFAAFTFDVSVMDMFMPLLAGAKVVLAPPETLHSPPKLAALLRGARVTFACLPPAVLPLLAGEDFPDLRVLLSAGEELSSELLRAWLRPGLEFYNGYGPTEASIGATFMKLEATTPLPPPIGRPKPNYQAYVLDPHLNPVPAGVTGELHIGGAGVARGYLNRPGLTRERFVPDPFTPGGRLYKTGDLARRRPDGTIVFAGRADNQVKIRGLRVELGEIEAALVAHPAIAQAVVTVAKDPAGVQQLAAYLCSSNGSPPATADVRQHLANRLPGYMIPTYLVTLGHFPLTAHGKIDKSALPAPHTVAVAADLEPPRTLIETVLVDLYATVLGRDEVGASDSFFDLGGNSLQAMQLITQLRATLAADLDVTAVFLSPTPRQLAALLRDSCGFTDTDLGPDGIEGLDRYLQEDTDGPAQGTS